MNSKKFKSKISTAASKASQFRQAAYEKVGKSENSLEPPALRACSAATLQSCSALDVAGKHTKQWTKALAGVPADAGSYISSLITLAAAMPEGSAALVSLMAEFSLGFADLHRSLTEVHKSSVDVYKSLVTSDAAMAITCKSAYDRTRLTAEAARDRVSTLKKQAAGNPSAAAKVPLAEQDATEATTKCEAAQREAQAALDECNTRIDVAVAKEIVAQFDAYREFFQKGLSWLLATADEVEELRAAAEERERVGAISSAAGAGTLYGAPYPEEEAPPSMLALCNYIEAHGLQEEGLFRVTGFKSRVDKLRAQMNATGEFVPDPDLPAGAMVHEAASLLKLYLRELPEPLLGLGGTTSAEWIEAADAESDAELHQATVPLLLALPPAAIQLLDRVLLLCGKALEFTELNRMSPETFAIVIAPSLLPVPDASSGNPQLIVAAMDAGNYLLSWMIRHWDELRVDVVPNAEGTPKRDASQVEEPGRRDAGAPARPPAQTPSPQPPAAKAPRPSSALDRALPQALPTSSAPASPASSNNALPVAAARPTSSAGALPPVASRPAPPQPTLPPRGGGAGAGAAAGTSARRAPPRIPPRNEKPAGFSSSNSLNQPAAPPPTASRLPSLPPRAGGGRPVPPPRRSGVFAPPQPPPQRPPPNQAADATDPFSVDDFVDEILDKIGT